MARTEYGAGLPQIDRRILQAIEQLEASGAECWLVGGAVRDLFRGVTPLDYDLAWSGRAETLEACVTEGTVVPTGLAHGTVTWILQDLPIEVTTYRSDGPYRDHRRPESVAFVSSITDDLARRDLTINAMAWHPDRGLLDPYGGRQDLEAKVIRTVGDPDTRYHEDALRILRTLRFAALLDATIAPETADALRRCAPDLAFVAGERQVHELERLSLEPAAGRILAQFGDALNGHAPAGPYLSVMDRLPQVLPLRFAAWSLGLSDPDARWMDDLPFRTALVRDVRVFLKGLACAPHGATDPHGLRRAWFQVFRILATDVRVGWLRAWGAADPTFGGEGLETFFDADGTLYPDIALDPKGLAISGHALLALGVPPGPQMGHILEQLWIAYTEGHVTNQTEALSAYVQILRGTHHV